MLQLVKQIKHITVLLQGYLKIHIFLQTYRLFKSVKQTKIC